MNGPLEANLEANRTRSREAPVIREFGVGAELTSRDPIRSRRQAEESFAQAFECVLGADGEIRSELSVAIRQRAWTKHGPYLLAYA